ncbi:MAG: OsmC family protein [Candidatus Obscuribacterales bacterium]|nr:OsmC family protein [Candidatus Obscuribacterales bacterium]
MSTRVSVEWLSGQLYMHRLSARQHQFFTDAPLASNGGDQAATPHEIFLLGLGGCVAMTVEMYAKSRSMDLKAVRVTITEDSIDDPDTPGTKMPRLTEELELEGNLSSDELSKLQGVAKRCPVYKLFVGKKQVNCVVKHSPPPTPATASAKDESSKAETPEAGEASTAACSA